MTKFLPISDYEWVDENSELFSDINAIMNVADDSQYGYIFEVDLHYPIEVHDLHKDLPFCPEKRRLPDEVFNILDIKKNKIEKLLLTLFDKENYVLHYSMLKLALKHGLKLKKVHRILQFKQSLWLKPYIDLNTELRTNAKNEFEKAFFKLLINAIFGKTMENLRLRANIKLVSKWGGRCGARMLIARPNFKRFRIFDENLAAIELKNTYIKMNKPIIIGMCVLDISKLTMYKFLYEFLKPKYNENCTRAYTDTDSFILSIKTRDFYNDMRQNSELFDTSDYTFPNVYNIERKNKKVPGLFKDELNGKIVVDFAGLRAKCYALRSIDEIQIEEKLHEEKKVKKFKRAKGVKKYVVSKKIKFNDYVKCIKTYTNLNQCQNTIRSIKHNVFTIQQQKIALNPADDKRYLIKPDRVDTLPWGHFKILDEYENK